MFFGRKSELNCRVLLKMKVFSIYLIVFSSAHIFSVGGRLSASKNDQIVQTPNGNVENTHVEENVEDTEENETNVEDTEENEKNVEDTEANEKNVDNPTTSTSPTEITFQALDGQSHDFTCVGRSVNDVLNGSEFLDDSKTHELKPVGRSKIFLFPEAIQKVAASKLAAFLGEDSIPKDYVFKESDKKAPFFYLKAEHEIDTTIYPRSEDQVVVNAIWPICKHFIKPYISLKWATTCYGPLHFIKPRSEEVEFWKRTSLHNKVLTFYPSFLVSLNRETQSYFSIQHECGVFPPYHASVERLNEILYFA